MFFCRITVCSCCLSVSQPYTFFPRASERRVLLIVGVCQTFSHLQIFTSSHPSHPIFKPSHLLILTSSHPHIFTSSHPHICSSSHFHLHIFTRSHLHILSFRLSISNLAYSEPGSPFPDCREGLTDRLSSSVLLPGIEPGTGRKRDAAITTELIPAPSSHPQVLISSHLHIFSSSHRIFTSSHLHILSSSHLHILTSTNFTSSHSLLPSCSLPLFLFVS